MNREFYQRMFLYLCDSDARRKLAESGDYETERLINRLFDDCEVGKYEEILSDLISVLRENSLLSPQRYNQFLIIEKEAEKLSGICSAQLFEKLFDLFDSYPISAAAGNILCSSFGEIVRKASEGFENDKADLCDEKLFRALSEVLTRKLAPSQVIVLRPGQEEKRGSEILRDITDGEASELEELVQCFLVTVGEDKLREYDRSRDTITVSGKLFEPEDVRIEDIVTFVSESEKEGVSFQLIGFKEKGCDEGLKNKSKKEPFAFPSEYIALRLHCPIIENEDVNSFPIIENENKF